MELNTLEWEIKYAPRYIAKNSTYVRSIELGMTGIANLATEVCMSKVSAGKTCVITLLEERAFK
jgi:hypothetical protein